MVRGIAVRTLSLPGIVPILQRWNRDLGIVFMLHRLEDPQHGVPGQRAANLRRALAFLRRHRFRMVEISELLTWARTQNREPGPLIAFTLDDGYLEQASIAAPIFAEFDVPATIFPATGFVDGTLWLWWDRLWYLLEASDRRSAALEETGRADGEAPLASEEDRRAAYTAIGGTMKAMSTSERESRFRQLQEILQVEIPAKPPARFLPLTWADARRCERMGVRFGPHTVTHPTLARESEARVRDEIRGSWARLTVEVAEPSSIFCYPNGRAGDFGSRERRLLAEVGMEGALTAEPGYVCASDHTRGQSRSAERCFELPRYSFPDYHSSLVRIASGLGREGRHGLPPFPEVRRSAGRTIRSEAVSIARARAASQGDD